MSESSYKPLEPREDELDELARSIREELRAIGFAPAFDPPVEQEDRRRRAQAALERKRRFARYVLASYVAPVLVIVALAVAMRLIG